MIGRLHALTDARQDRAPLEVVAATVGAGAPVVQVPAKGCTDRELFEFAERVTALCAAAGALCLVDDRVDVALRPAGRPVVRHDDQGRPAAPLGPAVGAVATAVEVPVVAIGGVPAARVPALLAAGAWGVTVVGAVSDAADPAVAVRELLRALGEPA